uniref:CRAL-TRIO domain-containing protein n=1 Tax=Ditylum brightwellii TaxID=49249 RepID=A0A6V2HBP8_9STRA
MQTANDNITAITSTEFDSALKPENDELDSASKAEKDVEAEKCLSIITLLSEDEKEKAARTSYKYLVASTSATSKDGDNSEKPPPPSTEERDKYAMAMARRHLRAENGNEKKALQKMRNTIEYRDKMKIDVIRQCFTKNESDVTPPPEEEEEEEYQYHIDNLAPNLLEGKLFVRGYSKDDRALYISRAHLFEARGYDTEWFLKYNIYTLERAIACTERATDGEIEKVIAIFDLGQYSNKVRTPLTLSKDITFCLRDHYPERLEKVFMIDAPFLFRAFYNLVYPFIDNDTKQKIVFVTGDKEKEEKLGNMISKDQSMLFMQPGGEMDTDLDMKAYLYETPFDFTCEEERNE